uniref:RING-type E3 ubiquitin transferase n=1 Tax=Leptobrachium leishanense TaxID=445787 RepID=A0A8C5WC30_9ANUR
MAAPSAGIRKVHSLCSEMAEEWDGRNAIISRNHMREMKKRIDLEYETLLRHQEREREQAERVRTHSVACLNTRHPPGNIYSTRSYKKPWQSGMTTKKPFSDQPAGERKHKLQDRSSHSNLPPIQKNTETIRRKNVSMYPAERQPHKPAAAINPRIMVQQKRLHTRQPQTSLMVLDRGATWSKGGKIPVLQSQTSTSHKLNDGKPKRFKNLEKTTTHSAALPVPHMKRLVTSCSTKKEVLTPILTTPRDKIPSQSYKYGGSSQVHPNTSNPTASPLRSISVSLNDLQEGTLGEQPRNIREQQYEDCANIGEGSTVSELSIFNSGREGIWEESQADFDPHELNENQESRWSPQDDRSIFSSSSSESDIIDSYLRESQDGNSSSDNEAESQTSLNFQGEFSDEAQDFQNLQERTTFDNRQRTNHNPSLILPGTQNIIPAETRASDQFHGSVQVTSEIFEEDGEHQRDNGDVRSIAHATDTTMSPISHIIPSNIRQNHDYLVDRNSREPQESRIQSTASSQSSMSSFAALGFGRISSAPSIDALHENLSLVFTTLSLQRQSGNESSGGELSTTEAKEEEQAKPDPERLKKLKESLLQEDSEEEEDLCRICLMGGDRAENPLISPCQCTGSLRYVHQECMKRWLLARITAGADLDTVRTCEMCKQSIQTDLDGFNLNEHYQNHQQTREQHTLEPSLYLLLLLHLYQRRYEELQRLNRTRDRVSETMIRTPAEHPIRLRAFMTLLSPDGYSIS